MRIRGNVKKKVVVILILTLEVPTIFLMSLWLSTRVMYSTKDKSRMVAVVNRTKIVSTTTCKKLAWSMQDKEFKAYMRLIP